MDNNRIDMGKVDRELSNLEMTVLSAGVASVLLLAAWIFVIYTGVS